MHIYFNCTNFFIRFLLIFLSILTTATSIGKTNWWQPLILPLFDHSLLRVWLWQCSCKQWIFNEMYLYQILFNINFSYADLTLLRTCNMLKKMIVFSSRNNFIHNCYDYLIVSSGWVWIMCNNNHISTAKYSLRMDHGHTTRFNCS